MNIEVEWVNEPAQSHPLDITPHHFALSVPDLEASIDWYRRIFGFAVEMRSVMADIGTRAAVLRRGVVRLELFQVEGAAPLPPQRRSVEEDLRTHGAKHFSIGVPDVRIAFNFFRSNGVDIAMDVAHIDRTVTGYIRDNSGILVEVTEPF